jgi:rfaE bifunctional protein nucleotidyltransferase chain/domain
VIVGFTNGCFDKLHPGHRYFLRCCHDLCDWLIVAVNTDESVAKLKGPERPLVPLELRLQKLSECAHVDAVLPFDGDPIPLIAAIRPYVVFRGEDQQEERGTFQGEVIRIPRLPGFSTTELLKSAHAP